MSPTVSQCLPLAATRLSLLLNPHPQVMFEDGSECMYGQDELLPSIITPPPPCPPIPLPPTPKSTDYGATETGGSTARYTIDRLNRVVRCDLSGVAVVAPVDEAYISKIMDTPDTTLIVKGINRAGWCGWPLTSPSSPSP